MQQRVTYRDAEPLIRLVVQTASKDTLPVSLLRQRQVSGVSIWRSRPAAQAQDFSGVQGQRIAPGTPCLIELGGIVRVGV